MTKTTPQVFFVRAISLLVGQWAAVAALGLMAIAFNSAPAEARDRIQMMDALTPNELGRLLHLEPGVNGEMLLDSAESFYSPDVTIDVDLGSQTLTMNSPDGEFTTAISSGRPGYSTITGCFRNPHLEVMHYSKKWNNSPMPHSVFFYGGFAIHGTYEESRLGSPASHGCVRVSRSAATHIFDVIENFGPKQTRICIYGSADDGGGRSSGGWWPF